MEWKIAPRVRLDLAGFDGLNCAGERHVAELHPVGGRQGQIPSSIKSLAIAGPVGTRVILMTAGPEFPLDQQSWRCIRIMAGKFFRNKEGVPAIRIPDLDWLDAPDARRGDPDVQSGFDQVKTLEEGQDWSFGNSGPTPLKGNVRFIQVDKGSWPTEG